jgi:carbonic anhydrase
VYSLIVYLNSSKIDKTIYFAYLEEDWDKYFKDCSGKEQSPIEIFTNDAVRNDGMNLKFINYDKQIKMTYLENNGHTGNCQ